ncbi:iron ABC transporter permease [Mameliella alba]|nr:iron ABC transporter permease [Antarctobacter heliothermus]MBY6144133.1 iron ABC transporter permease [Mameliella alba]MBY6161575.1 iron ABC transporter permease [Mameliella alba]MBY6169959.1 iron ABC transporter permease [Mameliella alba]MBY6175064.1 iron ABC transporter permease [Mameliella alba]
MRDDIDQEAIRRAALLQVLRSPPPDRQDRSTAGRAAGVRAGHGRFLAVTGGVVALLSGLALAGLMIGSVAIPAPQALAILLHWLSAGWLMEPDWRAAHEIIIVQTRIPRVILAGVVGASLGVSGMVIQAIVRNPLAGPSILGVSSGAATGAVVVMRFGLVVVGAFTLHLAAFLGGLAALMTVFWIARTGGQMTPTRLVLAGIALGAVLSALTSLLVLTSPDPQLAARVLFWTLGGFGSAQWKLLPLPVIALTLGLAVMLAQSRRLNLLMAGDESAVALGLDVEGFRRRMFLLTAALTGVTVALSGVIGFVGLIMPHIVRLLVGADHRRALPLVALAGASFTIAADLVARSIIAPIELPVGIVTALVGGPFFIWLLRRDARRLGGPG